MTHNPSYHLRNSATADAANIKLGIISPVDVLMRHDPDLKTRDDAMTRLLDLKNENKLLGNDTKGRFVTKEYISEGI